MLKALLRNTAIYSFSLFLLPYIISGVQLVGGVQTIFIGGIILTLMFLFLKPIFNVLTFPFNMISLGLFSMVTNAVILYLLTVFMPNIIISDFFFPGFDFAGFSVASVQFNTLFSFLAASVVLSVISSFLRWLMK